MTTFAVTLGASGQAILPGGDNLTLLTAPGDVTIELKREGKRVEKAQNVPVSYYWRAPQYNPNAPAFDQVIISTVGAQSIEVDISRGASGVNTVVGSVAVSAPNGASQTDVASGSFADTDTDTLAANANRKSITIYSDPANVGYLRVGPSAAANAGFPLPPGGSVSFTTTAAIDVHNESGAGAAYGYIEETAT